MPNNPNVANLEEKIHELKEYLSSDSCKECLRVEQELKDCIEILKNIKNS
jgi:hypothetical protein